MSASILKFPTGEPFKPRVSILDLPFVCDLPKGPANARGRGRACFWNVKPTGDYGEDCYTGDLYGLAYLRYANEAGSFLPWIVADMPRDLTGIEVGFLSMVDHATEGGLEVAERVMARAEQYRAEEQAKEERRAKRRKRTAPPEGEAQP